MNNKIERRASKQISLGKVMIGGDSPLTVQTMTKTDTRDVATTIAEIKRLAITGCEIIRSAVPDMEAAIALKEICANIPIPLIADIHFDHHLALQAMKSGVNGLRLNPGNMRSEEKIQEVIAAAKDLQIPVRVGVNAGSLDPAIKAKYGGVTSVGLAESALNEVQRLEKYGFNLIKIAVKAFDLNVMSEAVKIVASSCEYPIHLGVTESGLPEEGIIRSSIGIGNLLMQGIGDTIRVSLTGDSAEEVKTGIRILKSLGLRESGPVIVSCPTCGRCQIPLEKMAREVHERLKEVSAPIHVAVMGCAVNGPGEAEQADFGIAGGKDSGLIFLKGKIIRTLPADKLVDGLMEEINKSLSGKMNGENIDE